MPIFYWSFILLPFLLKVEAVSEKVSPKRLLLTDPNALLSRMEDLETKMLAMDAQITDQKSQLDVMKSHHKSGNVTVHRSSHKCKPVHFIFDLKIFFDCTNIQLR